MVEFSFILFVQILLFFPNCSAQQNPKLSDLSHHAVPERPEDSRLHSIYGYDCHDPMSATRTISLVMRNQCLLNSTVPPVKQSFVQVLQLPASIDVPVFQCSIQKTTRVFGCGKLSDYIWAYPGGFKEELVLTSYAECASMISRKAYQLANGRLVDLEVGKSFHGSYIAAGTLTMAGDCSGGEYELNGRLFSDAVAEVFLKIDIRSTTGKYSRDTGRITLDSGSSARFSDGMMIDLVHGPSYWESTEIQICTSLDTTFDVLIEGLANVTDPISDSGRMITLESDGRAIALEVLQQTSVCGFPLFKTDHPKLFVNIVESPSAHKIKSRKYVDPTMIDFSLFVNNKFVFVERHIGTEMTRMYRDLILQRCKIDQRSLQNLLTLSLISPDEFAYALTESPGYTSIVNGEVAHLIKCTPIPVHFAASDNRCYKEIRVTYGENKTGFLSPRNRILQTYGTEIACHPLLPTLYHISGVWISVYPHPMLASEPESLKVSGATYEYTPIKSLATLGVYSQEQLEQYQRSILFPRENQAIISTIGSRAVGLPFQSDSIQISNLLDEKQVKMFALRVAEDVFGFLSGFGSICSGIIGWLILYKCFLVFLNFIINFFALYNAYGFSRHLFAAFWDSLSHALVLSHHLQVPVVPSLNRLRPKRRPKSQNASDEAGPSGDQNTPFIPNPAVNDKSPHLNLTRIYPEVPRDI